MDTVTVGRELCRAIRGRRSQVAFSRRLGYRGNPVADWEAGRRAPTASELIRAARVAGIDVDVAIRAFHFGAASMFGTGDDDGVAAWLFALRGANPVGEVADRAGLSRFQVSRFLSGATRPRLPHFLTLVEALTGRMSDLVALLVPIEQVPSLADVHATRTASRRLAFEEPWTEAVLRVLETSHHRDSAHRDGAIAAELSIDAASEARCLEKLAAAGVIRWDGCRWVGDGPLTVDTQAGPAQVRALKAHWARVGLARIPIMGEDDRFSYNVFSVSRADYERIRALHLAYFREVRGIVAASEPPEVVALVNVQLMRWGE